MLLVDAHYEPARFRGAAAEANPSLLDNLSSRQQAMDVAFGKVGRYPFTACVPDPEGDAYAVICNRFGTRNAVKRFTDAKTWYPGLENRPDLDPEEPLFFRDVDASTVVPSKDNEIYSTRIVDRNGRLVPELFGTDMGAGHVLGTGNPADGRPAIEGGDPGTTADLSLGVRDPGDQDREGQQAGADRGQTGPQGQQRGADPDQHRTALRRVHAVTTYPLGVLA